MNTFFGYLVCLALLGDKKVTFANHDAELASVENHLDVIQSSLNLMFTKSKEQIEALTAEIRALQHPMNHIGERFEEVKRTVGTVQDNNELLLLNLTSAKQRADEIIANQQYCANHEALKHLFLDLPAKCRTFNATPKPPEVNNSTPEPSEVVYSSCSHVPQRSGVYHLALYGSGQRFTAYCEMGQFDGGWTVFQKRQDGSVDFNRSWTEYRNGFGDASGEYWLGLETLHELTFGKPHELMVILENFNGSTSFRRYDGFFVRNETQMYQVFFNGTNSGNASESLNIFNGEKFATYDAPGGSFTNCAKGYAGGFWFSHCASPVSRSSLNGVYGPRTTFRINGIWWYRSFRGYVYDALKGAQMMIRQR